MSAVETVRKTAADPHQFLDKVFTRRQAVAAWRRVKEPSTTKSSSSSRAEEASS